ncbi:MAG: VOC family protein [Acidimicrobiales bacterium]
MSETYPRLVAVVLDATDARELAEFYRRLLGFDYRPGDERPEPGQPDQRGEDWLVLFDQAGAPRLAIQQVAALPAPTWPDPTVPQQLHLDLSVGTIEELAEQHGRALSLGATLLEDRSTDPEESLNVYADPAGHPFCILVSPSAEPPH